MYALNNGDVRIQRDTTVYLSRFRSVLDVYRLLVWSSLLWVFLIDCEYQSAMPTRLMLLSLLIFNFFKEVSRASPETWCVRFNSLQSLIHFCIPEHRLMVPCRYSTAVTSEYVDEPMAERRMWQRELSNIVRCDRWSNFGRSRGARFLHLWHEFRLMSIHVRFIDDIRYMRLRSKHPTQTHIEQRHSIFEPISWKSIPTTKQWKFNPGQSVYCKWCSMRSLMGNVKQVKRRPRLQQALLRPSESKEVPTVCDELEMLFSAIVLSPKALKSFESVEVFWNEALAYATPSTRFHWNERRFRACHESRSRLNDEVSTVLLERSPIDRTTDNWKYEYYNCSWKQWPFRHRAQP